MAGGLPRTNSAMRFEVKSWLTTTCDWLALNFATRLLKYGTTSGLVSSNTMLVREPPEEHPAIKPGAARAAVPSPSAFIAVRRPSTGPAVGVTGRIPVRCWNIFMSSTIRDCFRRYGSRRASAANP